MSEGRLVDWRLAERIATALAGQGPAWEGAGEVELRAESDRAVALVRRYTRLRPRAELPAAELVGRDQWVRANLESFRGMSAEVESSLAESARLSRGVGGVPRAIAGAATGIQIGLAVGYLGQRVIGQYDVALLGPAREPRLLFVAPNLAAAQQRLDVDRELFLRWVALHEATHALQFAAVPWLRGHLGSMARELLGGAELEIHPSEMLSRLRQLDLGELFRSISGGDLASLLLNEEQRGLMDRIVAAMTVIEGYAEHVMDAVGDRLDPAYGALRRRLDADRDRRGPLDAIASKLLGLEMKLSQYRRGKAFADEVVRRGGIRALNVAWTEPGALPEGDEIERPEAWMERVGARHPIRRRLLAAFR